MSGNGKRHPRDQIDRLADAHAEDIITMSDEEFLAELKEDGQDLKRLTAQGRAAISKADAAHDKGKLFALRESYKKMLAEQAVAARRPKVLELSLSEKRRILEFNASRLTLAARHGDNASENDVDGLLEDMIELGVINEEGRTK